jgi:hypothetical protein
VIVSRKALICQVEIGHSFWYSTWRQCHITYTMYMYEGLSLAVLPLNMFANSCGEEQKFATVGITASTFTRISPLDSSIVQCKVLFY